MLVVAGPGVAVRAASAASAPAGAHLCLAPPVDGPVVEPFRAPPCPYCAGHRGITIATDPGSPVRAAAAGTVVFSGMVAGVRYVVVAHPGGWRTTYGDLAVVTIGQGRSVSMGAVLGLVGDRLHFGLRWRDDYVDPLPHLGEVRQRARLVPLDATPARPAGSWTALRCTVPGAHDRRERTTPSPVVLRGVAARGPR